MKLRTSRFEVGIDKAIHVPIGEGLRARVWVGVMTGQKSHLIGLVFIYLVVLRRGCVWSD